MSKKNKSYLDLGYKHVYFSARDYELLTKLADINKVNKTDVIHNALLLSESKINQDSQNYKLIKDFLIDNQKALEAFRVASDRQTDTIEQLVKIIKDLIITKQRSKK